MSEKKSEIKIMYPLLFIQRALISNIVKLENGTAIRFRLVG